MFDEDEPIPTFTLSKQTVKRKTKKARQNGSFQVQFERDL